MNTGKKLICILLAVVLVVTCIFSTVISWADEHYAVTVLKKLGLYSAKSDSETISYFDCGLLILMSRNLQKEVLQVTGDTYYSSVSQLTQTQANQVKQYFSSHGEYGMQSYLGGSAVLTPPMEKPSQMLETKVPSYVVYQAALAGLGYTPGKDFNNTKTEILAFAQTAGFQKASLLDTEASTYETLAQIYYEALFLNTKEGTMLLKQMCAANSTLAKAVEDAGIFAEVTTVLPDFTAGVLVGGSAQTGGTTYTETQVKYSQVTAEELKAYADIVKADGWVLQAAFVEEVESKGTSVTYYTFQKAIQAKRYFAVLALDNDAGILTVWYAC